MILGAYREGKKQLPRVLHISIARYDRNLPKPGEALKFLVSIHASLFARAFYKTLFERENVGIAFLEARKYVIHELGEFGDLTGYSAVLYGDAASEHRRDLAKAV